MLGLAPGCGQGVVHAVFPAQVQLFNVTHREPAPNRAQSVSEAQIGAKGPQVAPDQHSDDPSTSRAHPLIREHGQSAAFAQIVRHSDGLRLTRPDHVRTVRVAW